MFLPSAVDTGFRVYDQPGNIRAGITSRWPYFEEELDDALIPGDGNYSGQTGPEEEDLWKRWRNVEEIARVCSRIGILKRSRETDTRGWNQLLIVDLRNVKTTAKNPKAMRTKEPGSGTALAWKTRMPANEFNPAVPFAGKIPVGTKTWL
jgi:hypothetical protein